MIHHVFINFLNLQLKQWKVEYIMVGTYKRNIVEQINQQSFVRK